ncbi:hypothetical protein PHYPSEUDO_004854 [Phytophthora pseudosyringae]|uniref:Uncharacterized protein n=1 Tax=Phytophthora pseudosyringae TaxID=221518 RepID=A0A8T1VSJ3_9STRA|nr:hypothetical protein PHYPSEUDO_004854 [Phytophthora pseudosyringae]
MLGGDCTDAEHDGVSGVSALGGGCTVWVLDGESRPSRLTTGRRAMLDGDCADPVFDWIEGGANITGVAELDGTMAWTPARKSTAVPPKRHRSALSEQQLKRFQGQMAGSAASPKISWQASCGALVLATVKQFLASVTQFLASVSQVLSSVARLQAFGAAA